MWNLYTIGVVRQALSYLENLADIQEVPAEIIEQLQELQRRLTKDLPF